ncbi:MAG: universal stress protein, partial [Beijerinckiaceae bacterium]
MFNSILVPVDIAEVSIAQPAIQKAVTLAKLSGGKVRFIYVRPLMPMTFMEFVPETFDTEQKAEAEKALKELAGATGLAADQVTYVVRHGGTYPEVIAEAEAMKADCIVVGSHRPAMSTYLLGSNAAAIVRHATCSVLVIRQ